MKRILHTLPALGLLLLSACTSWHETAGDLAGLWQLAEWRDNSNNTIRATETSGIFYAVQLKLLKLQNKHQSEYYLAYYRHTPDSLVIERPMNYPGDTLVSIASLAPFGVPANGGFAILRLSGKQLVLQSEEHTLTFRKY